MRKGTTPKLTFTLPFDTKDVSCLRVIFAHNNEPVLIFDESDCIMNGNDIITPFTQEDTFLFKCDTNYQVQVRVKLWDGSVLASDIMNLPVKRCLDEEVL